MAKNIKGKIKLQIMGAAASPAPPVGPALGQHGIPIKEFTDSFNNATADRKGQLLPVIITVYEDRTFTYIVKNPPMSSLIKDKLKLKSGSAMSHKDKVGHINVKQMEEVATAKFPDLNAVDMYGAMRQVSGSARAMGITYDEIPASYKGQLPKAA